MRTTVDLSQPLLENAKRLAARRGITLSELVEDALRGHLAARPKQVPKPFHLYTVRGRLARADLDLDRISALVTLEDESEFADNQGKK